MQSLTQNRSHAAAVGTGVVPGARNRGRERLRLQHRELQGAPEDLRTARGPVSTPSLGLSSDFSPGNVTWDDTTRFEKHACACMTTPERGSLLPPLVQRTREEVDALMSLAEDRLEDILRHEVLMERYRVRVRCD